MPGLSNDHNNQKQKKEKREQAAIKYLNSLNFSYDKLINFTALLMVNTKERAENFDLIHEKLESENGIHEIFNSDDTKNLSTSAIIKILDEIENNSKENSPAAKSIKKAISMSNLEHKNRSKNIAKKGGDARSSKFQLLQSETIKLYKMGTWKSVPIAAQEITPKIVALSKDSNGDLLPSTTKPLEWIREHKKLTK